MKKIYKIIFKKVIPYYKKGREGDIEHIKWLFETIPKLINKSEVDFDILIPIVILHDVGYAKVPKDSNPYDVNIRKLHSIKGAEIAEDILIKLKYSKNKINEIKRLILKHDNWAFGDSFTNEPILRIFNNLDFMWMASKKGFEIVRKIMGKKPKEFYKQIEQFQQKNLEEGREWYNKKIEIYYKKLMEKRSKELKKLSKTTKP